MKIIQYVQGTAAIHVSNDEVMPPTGVVLSEFFRIIGDKYKFSVRPEMPSEGGVLIPQYVFQNGYLETKEGGKLPIPQLVALQGGDIVTASTTDIADKVLDDYITTLDSDFGYRFATATNKRKVYQSNIVVEFDGGLEQKIEWLAKIESLLTREIPRKNYPFKIKRLAFGFGRVGNPFQIMPIVSIANIENSDFVIERRNPEPYEKNRFYCGAPTTTSELVRILRLLEKEWSE